MAGTDDYFLEKVFFVVKYYCWRYEFCILAKKI